MGDSIIYYVVDCFSGQVFDVNFDIIPNINDIYYFSNPEIPENAFCGRVSGESPSESSDYFALSGYESCITCYQSNNINFFAQICTDPEIFGGAISSYLFTQAPSINNKFYKICLEDEGEIFCICVEITGTTTEFTDAEFLIDGPFNDCDCLPLKEVGPEYIGCYVCSGETNTITLPHPTWTDLSGKSVVLLDAVQLGGINGLNS